ncbi:MAG TPA: MFS transporter [Gammaproteobacteria bacterium]|nr:MFS transporter [Gammaproteobacteria bacterium]
MLRRVLHERNFVIYLVGSAFSLHGLWIQRVAIGWLAWELTASEAWLGLLALAELLPVVVFGPVFGVWADRLDRKTVAYITNGVSIALASLLCVLTALAIIDIYALWIITALLGCVSSAFQPVRLSLIPGLVPRELLSEAVAAQSIVFNVSRFLGPAIAGVAIAAFGLWSAFAMNAVSYLAMIAALAIVELRSRRRPQGRGHFLEEFREGFAYTYTHPEISWQIAVVAISALTGRATIVMLPAFAGGIYAGGSSVLATLTSVAGAGAVLAGFALTRLDVGRGLRRATLSGTIATGALMVALGSIHHLAAGIVVLAALGFCLTLVGIGSQTVIQTAVAESMRGRVLSLWAAVAFAAPALGGVVLGLVAEAWGLGPTTSAAGAACMIVAVAMAWRRGRRETAPAVSE